MRLKNGDCLTAVLFYYLRRKKMKKKIVALLCAASFASALIAGCGSNQPAQTSSSAPAEETASASSEAPAATEAPKAEATEAPAKEAVSDQDAADAVAAMIDAIYVQEWTEQTDKQCADAKAGWDALTDAQKELVEGENADPDYFGRDTGDASKDDPRNGDDIGENELLVVSFGTSFNDSRAADIGGIESALEKAYPDWSVRRAFTAQIILNHVLARDNEKMDNVQQALERAVKSGVKNLVIQPTHLMHGAEYDELIEAVDAFSDQFESVKIAEPLLGEVGADASEINADKEAVAKAVVAEAIKTAGFDSIEDADKAGTAFVLMGHGTSHTANVTYEQMQTQMDDLGYKNVFIGTVEGEPESTECSVVIDKVADAGYKKVILRPLMVVAGDHANNDMADPEDEESWFSQFTASGNFDAVECQIAGLGRIDDVQKIYVAHTGDVISGDSALPNGEYEVKFTTDSSMFHINEALDDTAKLTVKDGEMTAHITLESKNIVNLFPGLAEDAQKDGAKLLEPTTDTVEYADGTTGEVYGFDIPVPVLDEEFDLALIGTKGKWYDHKVIVSSPEGTVLAEAAEEDIAAAAEVADMIDAIYVQEWTKDTEKQCADAKAGWDALTDVQKELVEGENADPDYFGRDTGDASKDDPRNGDEIGENEILVVSFGTSFNDSRAEDIGGIEKLIEKSYPDWSVRRAFTAQIIINHILARDGEKIDNVEQALQRAVDNGVKNLIVQPTHLMHGAEYDELVEAVEGYEDKFESVAISEPLLGEVGADPTAINSDKEVVANEVVDAAVDAAGYTTLDEAAADGVAFVLMGHGTSHTANVTYEQMQTQMEKLGYDNVFIGTVEGEPESTECSVVIDKVKDAGYKKVILRPLMVVAGDHANNDMADPEDEESWLSQFSASGNFDAVECQIAGLGRLVGVEDLYVEHIKNVM
jgi:cobalamin biosynthesis Co2+ chelatase CbiK